MMRKALSCLLVMLLLLGMLASGAAAAESEVQHNYSHTANSGIRNEVCNTLAGTTVGNYYTDAHSYAALSALSGDALLESLRMLMTTTHTTVTSYNQCRDLAEKTDCENGDGSTVNLLYSGYVSNRSEFSSSIPEGWNREHVWPKSLGGFDNAGAGADLHHIRPTDSALNNSRNNDKYGYVGSGSEIYGTVVTGNAHGGKKGGGFMEPLDNVKGDVARICLYVYVRYGGELRQCNSITNVFQSVDVLLEWCALDPVDTWEMGRNEVVYAIQGNRNVFIDYPELAWQLFEKECPENVTTPSGGVGACEHGNQVIRYAKEANCGYAGYSGEIFCEDCDQRLDTGKLIPASGRHSFGAWQVIKDSDREIRSCTVCSFQETRHQQENGHGMWIWIAVSAGAVTACAIAAVVIVMKKKKQ